MKDKKVFILISLLVILFILVSIIMYGNYNIIKTNEKLKKEKYELKLKCTRLEEENLKFKIKEK